MNTQTKNRLKVVYLAWVMLHFILWAIAKPGIYIQQNYESQHKFFPFATKFKTSDWDSNAFEIDKVYDSTELIFYTIAPILIYYAISFWNKTPKD